jgi:glycosyltransferase involved in cell wall biosynthesis
MHTQSDTPVIGILTNYLHTADGVARHIFDLITGFREKYPEIRFIIFCSGGDGTAVFTDHGIQFVCIPGFAHADRSPLHFFRLVRTLASHCKREKISILHAHNHYHANIAALTGKLLHIPTVQTNHGILPEVGILPHFNAGMYIAINQHIVDYFKAVKKYPEEKYRFIRCGIPLRYGEGTKPAGEPKFIAAGRFDHGKGFDLFLKAAAIVRSQSGEGVFLLAGDGPERESLEALNKSLGSPVSFVGSIPDLPKFFSGTHVLVVPSRSSTEGFPRTIVEAAFANNFIITSRFRGVSYDFDERLDGFAFSVDDADGLAACMHRYRSEPAEAETRRTHFKNKAVHIFARDVMVEKTFTLYTELAGMCT